MRSLPGDPVDVLLGSAQRDMPKEELAGLYKELGLKESPVKQYWHWLAGWLPSELVGSKAGEALGRSYRDGRAVKEVIGERLPQTLSLVGLALFIAFSFGILLGSLLTVLRLSGERYAELAKALSTTMLALYSMPNFWLAFLVIALLAQNPSIYPYPLFGLHEPGEPQTAQTLFIHLIIPACLLSYRRAAKVALFIANLAQEELSAPYVLMDFAKGMGIRQVAGHVVRNCLSPVVNLLGLSLPALVGGSVLIETIFCVPGLGRLSVESTFARNYPVLMALTMLYGTIVVLSSLLADLLVIKLDPRLSEKRQ